MKFYQLQQCLACLSLPLLLSSAPGASALPILGGTSPLNSLLPSYRVPSLNPPLHADPMGSLYRIMSGMTPERRARIIRYLGGFLNRGTYVDMKGDRTLNDKTLARRGLSDDEDGDELEDSDDEQPQSGDSDGELEKRDVNQPKHHHEKRQVMHAFMNALFAQQMMPYVQAMSEAIFRPPQLQFDDYLAKWHPDWRYKFYKLDTASKKITYEQWKQKMETEKISSGMGITADEEKEMQALYAKRFKDYVALHHKLPSPALFANKPPYVDLASAIREGTAMLARERGGEAILAEAIQSQKGAKKATSRPVAAEKQSPRVVEEGKAGTTAPDFTFNPSTPFRVKGTGAKPVIGATMPKMP